MMMIIVFGNASLSSSWSSSAKHYHRHHHHPRQNGQGCSREMQRRGNHRWQELVEGQWWRHIEATPACFPLNLGTCVWWWWWWRWIWMVMMVKMKGDDDERYSSSCPCRPTYPERSLCSQIVFSPDSSAATIIKQLFYLNLVLLQHPSAQFQI